MSASWEVGKGWKKAAAPGLPSKSLLQVRKSYRAFYKSKGITHPYLVFCSAMEMTLSKDLNSSYQTSFLYPLKTWSWTLLDSK